MLTIDKSKTVLLVMDFQNDIVDSKGMFGAQGIANQVQEKQDREHGQGDGRGEEWRRAAHPCRRGVPAGTSGDRTRDAIRQEVKLLDRAGPMLTCSGRAAARSECGQ